MLDEHQQEPELSLRFWVRDVFLVWIFSFLSDEDVSLLKLRAEPTTVFLMTSARMSRAELLDSGLR